MIRDSVKLGEATNQIRLHGVFYLIVMSLPLALSCRVRYNLSFSLLGLSMEHLERVSFNAPARSGLIFVSS